MGGACSMHGPRCRWDDNMRMDLRETGLQCVDWRLLAEDRDQRQAPTKMVTNF
jgi:hypothetical protein